MTQLLFHQSATRVRAGVRYDRAGNPIADWSPDAVDRLPLTGLNIASRSQDLGEETGDDGTRATAGWWLQTRPGVDADIEASDRIEWNGLTLYIDGEPMRWPDPFTGAVHHLKVALTRTAPVLTQ
ncbi:hypothetical protein [Nocardiopsis synnemataformans]|uniref:hypothetical protein n=1 Tax=Nocardiopsis synnemataformans TaxID=61305 RepID=UPI003EB982E2